MGHCIASLRGVCSLTVSNAKLKCRHALTKHPLQRPLRSTRALRPLPPPNCRLVPEQLLHVAAPLTGQPSAYQGFTLMPCEKLCCACCCPCPSPQATAAQHRSPTALNSGQRPALAQLQPQPRRPDSPLQHSLLPRPRCLLPCRLRPKPPAGAAAAAAGCRPRLVGRLSLRRPPAAPAQSQGASSRGPLGKWALPRLPVMLLMLQWLRLRNRPLLLQQQRLRAGGTGHPGGGRPCWSPGRGETENRKGMQAQAFRPPGRATL